MGTTTAQHGTVVKAYVSGGERRRQVKPANCQSAVRRFGPVPIRQGGRTSRNRRPHGGPNSASDPGGWRVSDQNSTPRVSLTLASRCRSVQATVGWAQ